MRLALPFAAAMALAANFISTPAEADGVTASNQWGQGVFLNPAGHVTVMRGANYVVLNSQGWHATFEPSSYSAVAAESALSAMKLQNFDTVRVTLDSPYLGSVFGLPSSNTWQPYVAVLADFLTRAKTHGLKVMIAVQGIPAVYQKGLPSPMVEGDNQASFNDAFVAGRAQFFKDILQELSGATSAGPSILTAIVAIDIANEITVHRDQQPFKTTSGTFSWHGTAFDLSSTTSRQSLIDQAEIYLVNTVTGSIKSVDPRILTSMSQYSPGQVVQTGYNGAMPDPTGNNTVQPFRFQPLLASNADYIDIHDYEWGAVDNIPSDFATAGLSMATPLSKPMILSEYALLSGATTNSGAASLLAAHLNNACAFGVASSTMWTWNTPGGNGWTLSALSPYLNRAALPKVCSAIPKSDILVYNGIFHSNGRNYCWYDTWAHYQAITGTATQTGVKKYPRIPADMDYIGICTAANDLR